MLAACACRIACPQVPLWPVIQRVNSDAGNAAEHRKPGATVAFEFVERAPGEWVITSVKPAANPHAGEVDVLRRHQDHRQKLQLVR